MPGLHSEELARDLLGSALMFSASLATVCEREPLRKATKGLLTFPQIRLLELVSVSQRLTIHEASVFLDISDAAASQAVDRLVRRKLLDRTTREEDRRTSELSLTRTGKHILSAYESARQQTVKNVLERFSPGDLRRAAELLDRLSLALGGSDEAAGETCLRCGVYFRERCIMRGLGRQICFYEMHPARRAH